MHLNIFSFFFLSILFFVSACSNNSKQTAVTTEPVKTYVDICIVDAPFELQQYILLTNPELDSSKLLFVNNINTDKSPQSLPEADSAFKSSKFINGFYASYLSWEQNFRAPNPADTVEVAYWLNHLAVRNGIEVASYQKKSSFRVNQDKAGKLQFIQLVDSKENQVTEEIHAIIFLKFNTVSETKGWLSDQVILDEGFKLPADIVGFTHNFSPKSNAAILRLEDLKEAIYLNSINLELTESTFSDINKTERFLLFAQNALDLSLLSLKSKTRLEEVNTLDYQQYLMERNSWVYPITAIHPDEIGFSAVQKLIAADMLSLEMNTKNFWENSITGNEIDRLLYAVSVNHRSAFRNRSSVRVADFIKILWRLQGYPTNEELQPYRNIRIHKDEAMAIAYYHKLLADKHPWFEGSSFNRSEKVTLSNAALFIDLIFEPLDRFSKTAS